jgi:hypothetical protein
MQNAGHQTIAAIRLRSGTRTSLQTLGEILYCVILILEGGTVLVIEPTQLLKHLWVTGIVKDNAFVSIFGANILIKVFC